MTIPNLQGSWDMQSLEKWSSLNHNSHWALENTPGWIATPWWGHSLPVKKLLFKSKFSFFLFCSGESTLFFFWLIRSYSALLRPYSWCCAQRLLLTGSRDHKWCWRLNLGLFCPRQVLCLLNYHSGLREKAIQELFKVQHFWTLYLFLAVLAIEPCTSHMLGKCSTPEPYPQFHLHTLNFTFFA